VTAEAECAAPNATSATIVKNLYFIAVISVGVNRQDFLVFQH